MIKIEDKEYDFDLLPPEAKQCLQRIQLADAEIAKFNTQLGMFQTARGVYFQQLKEVIAQSPVQLGSDTIKLG